MEDQACPRCKTTKYRNPSLKMMVNMCGHSLCENCVQHLFVKGSGLCPECNVPLRRNNFRIQQFEDSHVEKEVDVRKRVLRDFNQKDDDFQTLEEFNDYLEMVEDIVYNLANNINIDATKQAIEQYKKENKGVILKNKSKLSREEIALESIIDKEHTEITFNRKQIVQEEKKEKTLKLKHKEALIDELMFSDVPAGQILATHATTVTVQKTQQRDVPVFNPVQFSTGIRFGQQEQFLPIPKNEVAPTYRYTELTMDLCGPTLPDLPQLESNGYQYYWHNVAGIDREKAGGFTLDFACYRALQEAMCGLYC